MDGRAYKQAQMPTVLSRVAGQGVSAHVPSIPSLLESYQGGSGDPVVEP